MVLMLAAAQRNIAHRSAGKGAKPVGFFSCKGDLYIEQRIALLMQRFALFTQRFTGY